MAQWLAQDLERRDADLDLVICSTAKRTSQTLAFLIQELAEPPRMEITRSAYLATTEALKRLILRHAGTASNILIVGHNPGLEMASDELVSSVPAHLELVNQNRLEKFPTAAAVLMQTDALNWGEALFTGFTLENFVRPRDL